MNKEKIKMIQEKHLPSKKPDLETLSFDEEAGESVNEQKLHEIMNDPILEKIDPADRERVVSDVFELYVKAKDVLAPVIAGFADTLLREASDNKQIIFAARDGLGAFNAANALLQKFPDRYVTSVNDLAYLYLTRSVVFSSQDILKDYIEQAGLDASAPTLIADIGMYGSIMYDLTSVLPKAEARYIISRNRSIPGFASDVQGKDMQSLQTIPGNPAVHFLEDTFSGTTSSPKKLVNRDGKVEPDMLTNLDAYSPDELLKRKYASEAFGDYVQTLTQPPTEQQSVQAVVKLDEFLLDKTQYQHLMVPHIR